MDALRIVMPTGVFIPPEREIENLKALGTPAYLIERAKQPIDREMKLKMLLPPTSTRHWREHLRFEYGDGTVAIYLTYQRGLPRYVYNTLDDLVMRGIISGYQHTTTLDEGVIGSCALCHRRVWENGIYFMVGHRLIHDECWQPYQAKEGIQHSYTYYLDGHAVYAQ